MKTINTNFSLSLTDAASRQLTLILQNDYTLNGPYLRLSISGKGCSGFDYQIGFDSLKHDDVQCPFVTSPEIILIMDPFTAHYCSHGEIDYLIQPETGEDGFTFQNSNEKLYEGKFFKDESMVPHHLANDN